MQSINIPVWKTAPFIRVLAALIAGILWQWYLPVTLFCLHMLLLLFFVGSVSFYFFSFSLQYQLRYIQSLCILAIVSIMGAMLIWYSDLHHHSNWYGNSYQTGDILIARIDEPLTEKTRTYKTVIEVCGIRQQKKYIPTKGKILVYFKKEKEAVNLQYGNYIFIKQTPQLIHQLNNPGSFNNQQYQFFQQIYFQLFLTSKQYEQINYFNRNVIVEKIYLLQTWVVNTIQKYLSQNKTTLGIAEALLIGYKNDLNDELLSAYANTGVVHIIAISGLHLGLIYTILGWLLDRTPLIKNKKTIKAIVLILFLWIFSLLCGASASVLRSAVMFTCIIIGKMLDRNSSIYNSLTASAFLLLCYKPYFLWDVGFQLSYAAIIGIVWLQKPIQNLLFVNHLWLRKVWEMSAVTIAAQVCTFPICLYYFHQFPNVFLFTNLVAVPLSTVILFLEIFLIILSPFIKISFFVGACIDQLISIMNRNVVFFEQLPFSVLHDVYTNLFITILFYAIIVCIVSVLLQKSKKMFVFFLTLFTFLNTSYAINNIQLFFQKKVIIYNTPHHTVMEFVYQREHILMSDTCVNTNSAFVRFYLEPTRLFYQMNPTPISVKKLLSFPHADEAHHKTFLCIDSCFPSLNRAIYSVDFLIISKNCKIDANQLLATIQPKQIILDATNSLWKIAQWKKQCAMLHLPCYSIKDQGAFVYSF